MKQALRGVRLACQSQSNICRYFEECWKLFYDVLKRDRAKTLAFKRQVLKEAHCLDALVAAC